MSTTTAPPAGHSNPAAVALRALRDGPGGRVLVVVAEPAEGALFPAGLRRPPARTALEAVLSYAADPRGYDRVVGLTGMNDAAAGAHLPEDVTVGEGLVIGLHPGAWELRGPAEAPPPPAPPPVGFDPTAMMRTSLNRAAPRGGSPGRRLATFQGQQVWHEQVEKVIEVIGQATGRRWQNDAVVPGTPPAARRTLLVLDEALLCPRPDQSRSALGISDYDRNRAERWLRAVPDLVHGSAADLVLIVRSTGALGALRGGQFVYAQVARSGADEAQLTRVPRFGWRDEQFAAVELRRLDADAPVGPQFAGHPAGLSVADVLRGVPPTKPLASKPRPAANPRTPDLRFWAGIDVDGLRERLLRDVIGQREAIGRVVRELGEFRQTCRDALAHGLAEFPRDAGEKPAQTHRPPVFMFLGESGMGKTFIAQLVAGHLFGDGHFELIEMTQKSAADELLGVRLGYQGGTTRKKFHDYARRTGGLGLVVFDELDKVQRENNGGGLDDAVSPFLTPLEYWSFTPNNPEFANSPDLRVHFANTLVVFTGNFDDGDAPPRPGYKRLTDLGAPLLGRLSHRVRFGVMEPDDVPAAVEFFVRKYARRMLKEIFARHEAVIDEGLVKLLAAEFEAATRGHPTARTFRVLEQSFVPSRLPGVKDKFRGGSYALGPADATGRWQPDGGSA